MTTSFRALGRRTNHATPLWLERDPRQGDRARLAVERVGERRSVAAEEEAERAAGGDRVARCVVRNAEPGRARGLEDRAAIVVARAPLPARHHEPGWIAVGVVGEPQPA